MSFSSEYASSTTITFAIEQSLLGAGRARPRGATRLPEPGLGGVGRIDA
jgi:hypothetical protein